LESCYLSLTDCLIEITGDIHDIKLPGFKKLPLGVFVRGVPGGSLEQVIFRLDVLHALHNLGITIYNSPKAIERTVDKPLTSLLLSRSGLPTPKTWICETIKQAREILERESSNGKKLVLKPLFGSQGIGIHLIDKTTGLVHDEKFAGIYYLQEFIERKNNNFTDIRVLVIGGVAKAAMTRHGESWVTNRAQGANCESLQLNHDLASLSEMTCKILDIDYAGVDLIQDKNGLFYIIEVNSIPAWYGLQKVVNFNIADCLIESFIKNMAKNNTLLACSN
jgi:RimK family alpha-L-glutamate ligase